MSDGGNWRRRRRKLGDHFQEIRAAHDTDQAPRIHDRQTLDAAAFHETDHLLERRVPGHHDHLAGHHLFDLAAVRVDVFPGKAPRAEDELQPAGMMPLRAGLGPPQQVALGNDADDGAARVYDRQAADSVKQYQTRRFGNCRVRAHGHDLVSHDIARFHRPSPLVFPAHHNARTAADAKFVSIPREFTDDRGTRGSLIQVKDPRHPDDYTADGRPRRCAGSRLSSPAREAGLPKDHSSTLEPTVTTPDAAGFGFDRPFHAAIAHATAGLSPLALSQAGADWLQHLLLSPDKQTELLGKAMRKWQRLSAYCLRALVDPDCPACIDPLPQDRRFVDAAWERWPFNLCTRASC